MRHYSIKHSVIVGLLLYIVTALPLQTPGLVNYQRVPLLRDWMTPTVNALVVNPKGWTVKMNYQNHSPADATTYYFGQQEANAIGTADALFGAFSYIVPQAAVITRISLNHQVVAPGGALNSEFAAYAVSVNNGSYTTVSSGVVCAHTDCTVANGDFVFPASSIPVAVGNSVNMRLITPTYTNANPTGVYDTMALFFQIP